MPVTFKNTIPTTILTNNGANKKKPFVFLYKYVAITKGINESNIPKYGV